MLYIDEKKARYHKLNMPIYFDKEDIPLLEKDMETLTNELKEYGIQDIIAVAKMDTKDVMKKYATTFEIAARILNRAQAYHFCAGFLPKLHNAYEIVIADKVYSVSERGYEEEEFNLGNNSKKGE